MTEENDISVVMVHPKNDNDEKSGAAALFQLPRINRSYDTLPS